MDICPEDFWRVSVFFFYIDFLNKFTRQIQLTQFYS